MMSNYEEQKKKLFAHIAMRVVVLVLLLYSENIIACSILRVVALDRFWQGEKKKKRRRK